LCTKQWLSSKEEEQEDGVLIYRPNTFSFPTNALGAAKSRCGINFLRNGSFSESRVSIYGNSTHMGNYVLKTKDGDTILTLSVHGEPNRSFEISAATDEALVLKTL